MGNNRWVGDFDPLTIGKNHHPDCYPSCRLIFLPCVCFTSIYASTAAKSYISNHMWTATNFIIKGRMRPRRLCTVGLDQGSPTWCPRAPGHPRACPKNDISMINVLISTNINNKIIVSKLSKVFISKLCNKLVALCINRVHKK